MFTACVVGGQGKKNRIADDYAAQAKDYTEDTDLYVRLSASLFALGDIFKAAVQGFKDIYSDFITFRLKATKVLNARDNIQLDNFLTKRNLGKDIIELIDWYMIKPVQRLTKYPLLLDAIMKALRKDDMFNGEVSVIEDVWLVLAARLTLAFCLCI